MIRAVLDANVVVSGILSEKGVPGRILKASIGERFHLVTSAPILEELRRVLNYSKIRRRHGWSEAEVLEFVEDLAGFAIVVPGQLRLEVVAEDPSDDRYLECALEGGAGCIVSGDRHLVGLGQYEGVEILAPRRFLDLLSQVNTPGVGH
jgi:putative PIN family toxin of toxin-antitoxin system